MRILTRYLIRAHVGPFLFALSALTGLLFLNAVAQRMEDLAGKGLPAEVIVEFMVFSLPHTVALTLPMAVLVAVLYAFTEMTAANEITAMKAGGIPPHRILAPMLVCGVLVGATMLYFNDRILPESNHQLKNLLLDINRKSPTFVLREQVVNRVQAEASGQVYFISAERIDNQASRLHQVTILDGTDQIRRRTTYADSGRMAFNEDRTDLYLTLFDGVSLEIDTERSGAFQRVSFDRQIVPLRGVGNEMVRQMDATSRGDREMTIAMLGEAVRRSHDEGRQVEERSRERSLEAVRAGLGLTLPDSVRGRWESAGVPSAGAFAERGPTTSAADPVTRQAAATARTLQSQHRVALETANRYAVEIHKKYSLAFACFVFVLIGIPLAIRFPRGGLGLVIAASSVIFAVYWVGLIAGEDVGDRGILPPALAMWIPNLIFTALGVLMVKRMGREAATTRGGGWDDLWWTLRTLVARPFRREEAAS